MQRCRQVDAHEDTSGSGAADDGRSRDTGRAPEAGLHEWPPRRPRREPRGLPGTYLPGQRHGEGPRPRRAEGEGGERQGARRRGAGAGSRKAREGLFSRHEAASRPGARPGGLPRPAGARRALQRARPGGGAGAARDHHGPGSRPLGHRVPELPRSRPARSHGHRIRRYPRRQDRAPDERGRGGGGVLRLPEHPLRRAAGCPREARGRLPAGVVLRHARRRHTRRGRRYRRAGRKGARAGGNRRERDVRQEEGRRRALRRPHGRRAVFACGGRSQGTEAEGPCGSRRGGDGR